MTGLAFIDLHIREGLPVLLTVTFEEVTVNINRHSLRNIKANTSVIVVYTVTRCRVKATPVPSSRVTWYSA